MDKEVVVHIYNGIFHSMQWNITQPGSFVETLMDLESIIQSEVNQEKNTDNCFQLIYSIQENYM